MRNLFVLVNDLYLFIVCYYFVLHFAIHSTINIEQLLAKHTQLK